MRRLAARVAAVTGGIDAAQKLLNHNAKTTTMLYTDHNVYNDSMQQAYSISADDEIMLENIHSRKRKRPEWKVERSA